MHGPRAGASDAHHVAPGAFLRLVATLAGEPQYAAFAFQVAERYEVALADGLPLPVVRMTSALAPS